jgi:replicative superfamily II helicase
MGWQAEHLESLLEPLGKHVRGFYGAQGGASLPKDTSVAVCTIEKANLLINKLLEEGRLSELAIIVIDELHMVRDASFTICFKHIETAVLSVTCSTCNMKLLSTIEFFLVLFLL